MSTLTRNNHQVLRIPEAELVPLQQPQARIRTRPRPRIFQLQFGEHHFAGMPLRWVQRATSLPGRSWQLICAVWFQVSCLRGRTLTVQLSLPTRRQFGLIARPTFYRALECLEQAGLVRVERRSGKGTWITLCPDQGDLDADGSEEVEPVPDERGKVKPNPTRKGSTHGHHQRSPARRGLAR
jgi:hypothetical protein